MAKKKSKTAAKGSSSIPGKSKLAQLSQIVSSYRPQKFGASYIKETLEELEKQVGYQQKPINELIKAQEAVDSKRFEPIPKEELKVRGEVFSKWLLENAPGCMLGKTFNFNWGGLEEGSGVIAQTNLKKHELFIRIPRKVMMTSTQASGSGLGKLMMKDPTFGSMPNLMLAMYVMFESLDPNSFYKPYLDVLPRNFSLPLFFTSEELAELRGSPSYYDALKIQKQTLRQYIMATKLLSGRSLSDLNLPPFTYRDFRWAVGIVMSRQNRIPSKADPKKYVLTLIPGWDFCNFRDGELTTQFNDDDGIDASESFTMADVKEGNQIFIYYGNRPNSKLFLFSGFVAEDHKTDYVEVLCSQDDSKSPVAKIRMMMLSNRRLTEKGQPFRINSATGEPSDACLTWLRICRSDKAEAATVLKAKTPLISFLSDRNESEAYALLKENVTKALDGYKTSVEQDQKLLGSGSLSGNAKIAVRLRLKEKLALQKCLKLATEKSSKSAK
mmetsp:Transcript_19887/g.35483  ORF Transcript_19887/g.35483 Transcript_19887/m.35483 type:complete len:498 (-) Transcript_19887:131-1624(-)|eukprot:CAMPEP_0197518670 /NCGR_PEP_ID=MMETSP1318-20131121/3897_1 /TAXON_ID=552666 /ORGANISM="Partenskyella glossopodia, Strain RCC365" /LENGTH=497 /DNA_ID=CAMNT_0043069195 /DNA_START=87 /DNA_END=1583 /DNA_ORIENTATION=-